jgi:hypothetical protein
MAIAIRIFLSNFLQTENCEANQYTVFRSRDVNAILTQYLQCGATPGGSLICGLGWCYIECHFSRVMCHLSRFLGSCMTRDMRVKNESWQVTHDTWHMTLTHDIDTWHVTHDRWHMTCDTWHVTHDTWHMTRDTWHMACDTWHVTHDMWHMTCDTWHVTHDILCNISLDE